jgi:hypothetical protein
MSTEGKSTFKITSWEEQPYAEAAAGPKLTRAQVSQTFSGIVEGKGLVEYLMVSPEDGITEFTGLERVTGKVAGCSGSFVLQHTGTYAGNTAKSDWLVVEGSGTGDLRTLRGKGSYNAIQGSDANVLFDYDFG